MQKAEVGGDGEKGSERIGDNKGDATATWRTKEAESPVSRGDRSLHLASSPLGKIQVSVRHRTSTSLSTIKSLMAERLFFSPTDRALKIATITLRVFLVEGLSELSGTEMRFVKSTPLAFVPEVRSEARFMTAIFLCFRLPPLRPRNRGRSKKIRKRRRREVRTGSRGGGFTESSCSRV